MKRVLFSCIFWLTGLAVCGAAGWLVYHYSSARADRSVVKSEPKRPAAVEVYRVQRRDLAERIEFIGVLKPKAKFTIQARTLGSVRRLPFDLSDRICRKCGKLPVVVKLDETAALVQCKTAKAELQEAVAQLGIDRCELTTAKKHHQRVVLAESKKAVTRAQVEEAAAAVETAEGKVSLAEARVARANASVEQSRNALQETRIVAPSSGVVSVRFVEIGQYVRPGDALLTMIDISTVTCIVRVVERDYPYLSVGQTADVRIGAYPGERFYGRVARKAPFMDDLRTAAVHVEIDNADHLLKPGMHGRITVVVRRHHNALAVPAECLVRDGGHPAVFVVRGDPAKVERRRVRVGVKDGDFIQILSSLSKGDTVVTTGSRLIKEGQQVKVVLPTSSGNP